jgi:drug/metabolite transporter (DMT)-like permease
MLRRDDLPRGAAYMTLSALLFAVMGACVKLAAAELSNAMVVFLRNGLALVVLLPWALRPAAPALETRRLGGHLVRGVAGLLAMYCFFFAIARLRLADAVLLNYSLPLFMPFIERLWLGEPLSARLWPPIGLGFLGLVIILRPGLGVFDPVALVALLAAVLAALAQVAVRTLTRDEPVTRIVLYFSLISTLGSLPAALLDWRWPGTELYGVLATLGVSATLAQLAMTRAYGLAAAARVGPFVYAAVVFAGLLDWLVWSKLPDLPFLAGALLVCAAGVLVLRSSGPTEPTPRGG